MKKGFTLIELLAVIVILAIISAIAIPIVIKVIDNAKVNSLKISMSNIEKTVELYINKNSMQANKVFSCSDGICKDELNNKLELSGITPQSGSINVTKSGTIIYNKLIIDGYLCDKYNKEFVCNKTSKNIEETKENSIIIQNTSNTLNNYKIYGNSILNENYEFDNVGDVLIFNQLIDINSAYLTAQKGITLTKNVDNSITLNGTSTDLIMLFLSTNMKGYGKGHKIMFYGAPIGGSKSTYWHGYMNGGGGRHNYDGQIDVGNGIITTINDTYGLSYVLFNIESGTTLNNFTFWPICIDLTLMYGEGNEPTSIEQVKADCKELGYDLDAYQPYERGKEYYKIPVKVRGKNLFPLNDVVHTVTNINYNRTIGNINVNLPAGQKITVSADIDATLAGSDTNAVTATLTYEDDTTFQYNYWLPNCINIPKGEKGRSYTTVTATKNVKNISFSQHAFNLNTDGTTVFSNFQIAVGNDTSYEPYKEAITNIYLDKPLRKLESYVDYIDYKNQKEVRNVGVLKLSSEDSFELIDNYFILNLENYPKKDKELLISNYLEYGSNFWFDGNKLKLKIEGINTVEELKTWLSNKNIEIYYPLNKSIVNDIELPEISLNKNYSNITVNTNIKPSNMLIEYD